MDPQNDWSEDGSCPECDGYALIQGNGSARNGFTVSCEGPCGTFAAQLTVDGVERIPAPATRPASTSRFGPFSNAFPAADVFGPDDAF